DLLEEVEDRRVHGHAPALRLLHRFSDALLVLAGRRVALAEVGPVHGERRDRLGQRVGEAPEREVAPLPAAARDALDRAGEHLDLAGEAEPQDELLAHVDVLAVRELVAGEPLVERGERLLRRGRNPEADEAGRELVAGRAVDGPLRGELLARL